MGKEKIIKEAAEAVASHLPETTSAIDKAVSSIVGVLDVLLAPFQALKIYKDAKLEMFKANLARKIEKIPPSELNENPSLSVVGPALESLKYTIMEDELRELFENLLASSVDKRKNVFPSFVYAIRQLSPDEAKLLKRLSSGTRSFPLVDLRYVLDSDRSFFEIKKNFSNLGDDVCEKPELIPAYMVELEKLGIISIEDGKKLTDSTLYDPLESHGEIARLKKMNTHGFGPGKFEILRKKLEITEYGVSFISACVSSKE